MKIKDVKKEELSTAIQQYYDIKMQNYDCCVFFQMGDFYELFFDDAVEVSQLLELTLTKKSAGLDEKIPMAGVPLSAIDDYTKRLIKLNKKVAIVNQDDSNSLGKKVVDRNLSKIITPGTYMDPNSVDNNYVGCIYEGHEVVLAYGDLSTGEVFNINLVSADEAFNEILALGIKEVVDPYNILNKYDDVIEHYNINAVNFEYNEDTNKLTDLEIVNDILLSYFKKVSVNKIDHINKFILIEKNNYMGLNIETQKQLELITTLKDNEYVGSLFWYLNKTNTAMGRRMLKRMIIHPLVKEEEIVKRHNIVEKLLEKYLLVEELNEFLSQVYDFERLIGRVSEGTITPKEIVQLRRSIKQLPNIKEILQKFNHPEFDEMESNIESLEDIYRDLEKAILDEPANSIKDGAVINNNFDIEIDRLRGLQNNSNKWFANFEAEQKEKYQIRNLKIKYNKIFGYFIEIPNGSVSLAPEHYIKKQTMANCERFITEELKHAENEILNSTDKLLNLETAIFNDIKLKLKSEIIRLQAVANKVAYIDVLISFCKVAKEHNLIRPNFNNQDELTIHEGFHPIVKKLVDNYITNDIEMKNDQTISLITGPNMAGKSTYMRQVVLTVVMAQIGSYVPCSYANLKVFDKIFTRIGASDDLAQGKSTFMVEMDETSLALNNATKDSLIIFDELGRGTSTYDGIALANAILEYIHNNIQAKTLFSTHYHELIDLDKTLPQLQNSHVKAELNNGEITFFHKVLSGGVERSYGIEVAKLADLPSFVIGRSNQVIKELEQSHEKYEISEKEDINKLELELENEILKNKLEKLSNIDVDNITPIEALQFISNIKKDLT